MSLWVKRNRREELLRHSHGLQAAGFYAATEPRSDNFEPAWVRSDLSMPNTGGCSAAQGSSLPVVKPADGF